uniref:Uncharacterized protein n=1 Tax=Sipha flava TaxID=143950 RepID=A0A2S2R998_9HEMI
MYTRCIQNVFYTRIWNNNTINDVKTIVCTYGIILCGAPCIFFLLLFTFSIETYAHTQTPPPSPVPTPPRYIRLHTRLQIIRETKTTIGTGLQTGRKKILKLKKIK